MKPQPEK